MRKTEIKREKRRKTCVFQGASFLYALRGGGEPRSKKVDNQRDLLTNLPRTEVVVPNPTYRVFVIGRRVLNYCGGFGVEE